MDIAMELRTIAELCVPGDLHAGLRGLRDLWDRIPSPKEDAANAYLVVEYGVALSLRAGDLDQAEWWAKFPPDFAKKRHDLGEVEFLIGKIAFARGDMAAARNWFLVADRKSAGRIFDGEDRRYARLIM